MKYLIVGLGNIGVQYEATRHNIGFMVLDALCKQSGGYFTQDRMASVCELKFKGRILLLIKPTTLMNLSGRAFQFWQNHQSIPLENCLVIGDDISLPLGELRLKPKGSDGGHNGFKNIAQTINSTEFPRLRFGIGHDFHKGGQSDYVLGKWTPKEMEILTPRIDLAVDMIKSFTTIGIQLTMTDFNKKLKNEL